MGGPGAAALHIAVLDGTRLVVEAIHDTVFGVFDDARHVKEGVGKVQLPLIRVVDALVVLVQQRPRGILEHARQRLGIAPRRLPLRF